MTGEVQIRRTRESDLSGFFEMESDADARWMAAFGNEPTDRKAYIERWQRSLSDPKWTPQTVLLDGRVVGYLVLFELFGKPSVGYWYARDVWGHGVATRSLLEFLRSTATRPLYARVAKDNLASIRVLEKCAFALVGQETGFAKARNAETEELVYRLDRP